MIGDRTPTVGWRVSALSGAATGSRSVSRRRGAGMQPFRSSYDVRRTESPERRDPPSQKDRVCRLRVGLHIDGYGLPPAPLPLPGFPLPAFPWPGVPEPGLGLPGLPPPRAPVAMIVDASPYLLVTASPSDCIATTAARLTNVRRNTYSIKSCADSSRRNRQKHRCLVIETQLFALRHKHDNGPEVLVPHQYATAKCRANLACVGRHDTRPLPAIAGPCSR
jgi:hypothetical protein